MLLRSKMEIRLDYQNAQWVIFGNLESGLIERWGESLRVGTEEWKEG
jgi:hypothetical protein